MRKLLGLAGVLFSLGCIPTSEVALCDNAQDDDKDGTQDCEDVDCQLDPVCGELVCDDLGDNDNDGDVDCEDADCASFAQCQLQAERCDNAADDDGDFFVDCEDADCASDVGCAADITAACSAALSAQADNADDTTGGTNLFAGSNNCSFGVTGDNAPEDIFVFTPTNATVTITLTPTDAAPLDDDLALYVRSSCEEIATELGCEDSGGGAAIETLTDLAVTAGQPVFIFVDGFLGDFGPYTLAIQ